jgi:hypothetical protein
VARIVKGTGVVFPELKQLQRMLADYPKGIRRKYMKAAFNAAAKPGMDKLKQLTPKGPTGNLKRAVVRKATPNYGLAGYASGGKPGDTRRQAYHQGLVEFGTKQRRTKSRFASTFASKTPGRGGRMVIKISKRGSNAGKISTLSPKYPKSFFKGAAIGQRVDLKRMPMGGRTGKPPVKTAFEQARGQITTVLRQQVSTVIGRANADMARRMRAT